MKKIDPPIPVSDHGHEDPLGSPVPAPPGETHQGLDDVDRQILRTLQAEGRLQNLQLASKLHLPPSSVHKRVARLESSGYIAGFEAVLNPEKFPGMLIFARVKLETGRPRMHEAFRAAAQAMPSVMECFVLESGYFLLKVRVPNIKRYHHLMSQLLAEIKGTCRLHSQMVMEEIKQVRGIRL